LQEDNLVENIRGKGNYIKSNELIQPTIGMETLCHPVKNCCSVLYDKVELELRLELPTEAILENLKEPCSAIAIIDRWYLQNDKAVSYSLTFLPIETVSAQQLNLQDTAAILSFLEEKLYVLSSDSILQLTHSNAGNFTARKYTMSPKDSFEMIHETLYDQSHRILCYSKHYIPSDNFHLHIHGR
ncbi:MAG: UTRA domain-containing protein, partial [Lachnospiraceae bacterium]|nr:UTRA domain-containing protein [Lachnospiraceae bacterium]